MDIKIIFSVFSVAIGLWAFLPYFKGIVKKEVQPHAFTWLVWTITQGTATIGLWTGGGGAGAAAFTIGTFFTFSIFCASLFNKDKNITKSDVVILIAALSATSIWWLLDNPVLAVLLVSIIDVIGYIPTFRKSYKHPWTEETKSWTAFSASNLFSILALKNYNFLTLGYLVIISITNITLLIFLLIRRRNEPNPSHNKKICKK